MDRPKFDQIIFANDSGGHIVAHNTSLDDTVQLFFPGNTSAEGDLIRIPPFNGFDVTPSFNGCSAANVNEFTITPEGNPPGLAGGVDDAVTIQSQGHHIQATGVKVSLGNYMNVSLSASDRTIQIAVVGTMVLTGVVLLNIRGAGNQFVKIINAVKKVGSTARSVAYADDDQSQTLPIPDGIDLTPTTLVSLDAIVAVDKVTFNAFHARALQKYSHRMKPLTQAEVDDLKRRVVR
ncbi:hypothetical protein ACLEPN_41315 [Myxococcus sp. 1LA]